MKKMSFYVALVAVAGIAMASSLGIPWFADTSPQGAGFPPSAGVTAFIQLKNNTSDDIECNIVYYNGSGQLLPFPAGEDNTFVIPAFSSSAFRPAIDDPIQGLPAPYDFGIPGGQETLTAVKVPNCPNLVPGVALGSATIEWQGGVNDIQGACIQVTNDANRLFSYAYTLPDGRESN
jgi:hypothetical protein